MARTVRCGCGCKTCEVNASQFGNKYLAFIECPDCRKYVRAVEERKVDAVNKVLKKWEKEKANEDN